MATQHEESALDHAVEEDEDFAFRLELGDVLVGAALLALSITFWVLGAQIDDGGEGSIGAATFPRGIALLLGIGALVLFANGLRQLVAGPSGHWVTIGRPLRVLMGIALMLAFAPAMRAVGYYPTMAVYLAATLWVADCRRPLLILAYVAGFLLFSKLVFEMLLSIPLP
ncbi:tripartite tricarboxylate transporter TctB family protein [Ancylobacter sp. MQZ15Z-1]|uniref:Tripartite tricarboxylate transporter TctB family protein n=1 Tax=Ancylobacter mangrovi TaxID=2972472 RepID=A0A9X2PN82_9HYPH|nr:tripartite tricarboxylate transporter TctB family protein [Ancylobacter mangrovi]MCS0496888.1 tripartite tricarboxylate transporter TctB family protein [Ancylobacter mangrovi]